MKADLYSKIVLGVIALGAFAGGRASSGVASPAPEGEPKYRDFEFIPQGDSGFIALDRHTGEFNRFVMNSTSEGKWFWRKFGPTGNVATTTDSLPTTAP